MKRLDQFLSANGQGTRSAVKGLIRQGKVRVNDAVVRTADFHIDPERDRVFVQEQEILNRPFVYLMLHKPKGVVCATEDRRDPTVLSLVPAEFTHYKLFPAGRLDKNTTGFVLLTNDGAFAHRILSPRHHVEKIYTAELTDPIPPQTVEKFAQGFLLKDGTRTLPAKLHVVDTYHAVITLREGKYHQIKRMFAACGTTVKELHRSAIGGVFLDATLQPGQCRPLTMEEEKILFSAASDETLYIGRNR